MLEDYLREVTDFETIKKDVKSYIEENKTVVTFRDVFDYCVNKYGVVKEENCDIITALYVLSLFTFIEG